MIWVGLPPFLMNKGWLERCVRAGVGAVSLSECFELFFSLKDRLLGFAGSRSSSIMRSFMCRCVLW